MADSNFSAAVRAMLGDELVCVCGACNRPGVHEIKVNERGETATCTHCFRYGPLAKFSPHRKDDGR